ncbi:hypothetical protein [Methylobacter sp.]|uniref:hypothetical protein n=1 Tax=Methylobacter sp. TaxID=2051955 RepID=UPI0011F8FB96|nr:hypothetical protein [Methylobacter sp.]TAK60687.1 MAG: hypothetical protein EPO18_16555 [Methylobacter sp.]
MLLDNRSVFYQLQKGILMIINWVAEKAQQFISAQDAELDELSINFDFALSAEIIGLLYAQNNGFMNAEDAPPKDGKDGIAPQTAIESNAGAVAEAALQDEVNDVTLPQFVLDEHELALA